MVHVGRQPVYDRDRAVIGYELLFRADEHALGAGPHGTGGDLGTRATSQVIVNAFTEFGLDRLVGSRLAFINLTRDFLVGGLNVPFEPGSAVLEILETVEIDEQVFAGVESLVKRGYAIALDDFVWGNGHERLLPLASYVKLDTLEVDPAELAAAVAACRAYPGVKLVAERVETEADVELAHTLGFELFQGYALGRPQVISVESLSPSRLRWMQILGHLTSPDIELTEVSALVREDASLSYRVLRALNSASVGLGRKVSSVHDAIVLLGPARLRQWLSLMVLSGSTQATEEQLTAIMTRARLCQTVAIAADLSGDAAFTVGLLSGISDRLGVPLIELLARLPLEPSVMDALVRGRGRFGGVLGAVRAYEAGNLTATEAGLPEKLDLAAAYLAAVDWAVRACAEAFADA